MSNQLIIAGFHRSGTSATAMLLHRAGLFIGHRLLGAAPSNPYGHFEDKDFVQIHDDILADNGLDWQVGDTFVPIISDARWQRMTTLAADRNTQQPLWGFKDPRVCLFMTPWKYLMPSAKFVIVSRRPTECWYSLARRHSVHLLTDPRGAAKVHRQLWKLPDLAMRMWLNYNRNLLYMVKANPKDCLVVPHQAIAGGFPLVQVLNDRWSLGLHEMPTEAVFDQEVTTSMNAPYSVTDARLIDQIMETWEELEAQSAATLTTMKTNGRE